MIDYENDIEIVISQNLQALFKLAREKGIPIQSPPFVLDSQLRMDYKKAAEALLLKYLIPEIK